MKYKISNNGDLFIRNDLSMVIFLITTQNHWFKTDYDQNCREMYRERSNGLIKHFNV